MLKRTLQYHHGIIGRLREHLSEKYHCEMDEYCTENVINMMTNEFPTSAAKKTYAQCVFLKKEQDDYGISDVYGKMLQNPNSVRFWRNWWTSESRDIRSITVTIIRIRIWYCIRNIHMRMHAVC